MTLVEYTLPAQAESLIGSWIIPSEICNDIIDEFESKKQFHHIDKSNFRNYTSLTSFKIDNELDKRYIAFIDDCVSAYTEKYPYSKINQSPWGISKPYNIQRYNPGNYYSNFHCETYGPVKNKFLRHLVWMTYLNDVEGGTEFLYQNIKTKPKKGLTLIWPAVWTHTHKGIPCNEVKYIVTGWISYSEKI